MTIGPSRRASNPVRTRRSGGGANFLHEFVACAIRLSNTKKKKNVSGGGGAQDLTWRQKHLETEKVIRYSEPGTGPSRRILVVEAGEISKEEERQEPRLLTRG